MQKLGHKENLCRVCSLQYLKNDVKMIIQSNPKMFNKNWSTNFEKNFERSLKNLYPLIFEMNDQVHHVPSSLMSYILGRNLDLLDDKKELYNLLGLTDSIKLGSKIGLMALRTSNFGKAVQSGPCKTKWANLITELPRVSNRIIVSKAIANSAA